MFSVDYTLDIKAYQQYFSYRATHDKKIVRLCLTLIIALTMLFFCVMALINGLNWITIGATVIVAIILAMIFPKIYWKIQFKRIDMMVSKMDLTYNPLKVTFKDKCIEVSEKGKTSVIENYDVQKLDFTHDYGYLFYKDNDKPATLIFPINALSQDQLQTLIVRF